MLHVLYQKLGDPLRGCLARQRVIELFAGLVVDELTQVGGLRLGHRLACAGGLFGDLRHARGDASPVPATQR